MWGSAMKPIKFRDPSGTQVVLFSCIGASRHSSGDVWVCYGTTDDAAWQVHADDAERVWKALLAEVEGSTPPCPICGNPTTRVTFCRNCDLDLGDEEEKRNFDLVLGDEDKASLPRTAPCPLCGKFHDCALDQYNEGEKQ
jgi:hypothetical protein